MTTLLLIDGLNLVRRVYEANPSPDSPEKAKQAVRNSIASFDRAFTETQPTHALAVFDFGGETFRHRLFSGYRRKRKPMPAELREVLPDIKERIHQRCVLTMALPDVEADDVLASAARQGEREGFTSIVAMTTDKDVYQLVNDCIRGRHHFEGTYQDVSWVVQKFGVQPHQMLDYLSLVGDTSDDVPGVAHIGPKTAVALLAQFGTLDNILASTDQLTGRVRTNLENGREMALLSRQLIRLKEDLDLGLTLMDLSLV